MRKFIFKAIVITFIFIVGFEFTIGKRIDPIVENMNRFTDKQGRKELIISLKNEMAKAIESENYLTEEERVLINKFIWKIKRELNSVENN